MRFTVVVFFLYFSVFNQVEASVFSTIKNLFSSDKDEVVKEENSQTMHILESSSMVISKVKGFVVDENSLAILSEEQSVEKHVPLISTYVVKQGDTLSTIAKMFGVSVNTVLWSNNLTVKDAIKPGQSLVILPVSGISHTVKKGDTLSTIASSYKADLAEIRNFNGLSEESIISIGDVIIVPDGEPRNISSGTIKVVSQSAVTVDSSGYFIRPINGGVKSRGIHGYNAVDIAAPIGTNIFASAGGKVIISKNGGWNGGYGNYIVISHSNGMQTLYAHLSSAISGVGETVKQGDLIGRVGSTGKSTGPHLHFEIRGGKNPF
jgi:murein DD-endopeptidase MepM/ murein hydrolase activator NlpD